MFAWISLVHDAVRAVVEDSLAQLVKLSPQFAATKACCERSSVHIRVHADLTTGGVGLNIGAIGRDLLAGFVIGEVLCFFVFTHVVVRQTGCVLLFADDVLDVALYQALD